MVEELDKRLADDIRNDAVDLDSGQVFWGEHGHEFG